MMLQIFSFKNAANVASEGVTNYYSLLNQEQDQSAQRLTNC